MHMCLYKNLCQGYKPIINEKYVIVCILSDYKVEKRVNKEINQLEFA